MGLRHYSSNRLGDLVRPSRIRRALQIPNGLMISVDFPECTAKCVSQTEQINYFPHYLNNVHIIELSTQNRTQQNVTVKQLFSLFLYLELERTMRVYSVRRTTRRWEQKWLIASLIKTKFAHNFLLHDQLTLHAALERFWKRFKKEYEANGEKIVVKIFSAVGFVGTHNFDTQRFCQVFFNHCIREALFNRTGIDDATRWSWKNHPLRLDDCKLNTWLVNDYLSMILIGAYYRSFSLFLLSTFPYFIEFPLVLELGHDQMEKCDIFTFSGGLRLVFCT